MNSNHHRHLGRRPVLLPFAVLWASEAGAAGLSSAQAGTAMALVVAVVVVLMAGLALHREQRRREVAEEALAASTTQQQALIDTMVDAVITLSDSGTVQSFNPAAETMFGYTAGEVIGHNIRMLMPEPYHSEHDGYLARHLLTGECHVLGHRRELEAQHRDGSTFSIELAVTDMHIHGQRLFSGIVRDITERKKMDKLKEEFVSTVSHELRTPLTAIRGSLGLLTGGAAGDLPQQASALLKLAHNNSERLLLLINDLLDMDKIASGKLDFRFGILAVSPFIEEALTANAVYAEQHGVHYAITHQLETAHVRGDGDRLMQVMANLLSNASKFSPQGGTVEIGVTRHDNQIRISISDHGPGIPEEFHPKLFEKFTQADASDTRQVGGTGLGLNISKAIVEKHGGQIGFTTQTGAGTTFYFELMEIDMAAADPASP